MFKSAIQCKFRFYFYGERRQLFVSAMPSSRRRWCGVNDPHKVHSSRPTCPAYKQVHITGIKL